MEYKSKGKTVVIVILVLVILGLGGYIVYDKVLSKGTEESVKKETTEVKKNDGVGYTYDQVKGLYVAEETFSVADLGLKEEDLTGGVFKNGYRLCLYEDGIYYYQRGSSEGKNVRELGNYIIKDNEIILNPLFEGGSDAGLNIITKEVLEQTKNSQETNKPINFNYPGPFTISQDSLKQKNLVFTKEDLSLEENKKYFEGNNIRESLKTAYIETDYSGFKQPNN